MKHKYLLYIVRCTTVVFILLTAYFTVVQCSLYDVYFTFAQFSQHDVYFTLVQCSSHNEYFKCVQYSPYSVDLTLHTVNCTFGINELAKMPPKKPASRRRL